MITELPRLSWLAYGQGSLHGGATGEQKEVLIPGSFLVSLRLFLGWLPSQFLGVMVLESIEDSLKRVLYPTTKCLMVQIWFEA